MEYLTKNKIYNISNYKFKCYRNKDASYVICKTKCANCNWQNCWINEIKKYILKRCEELNYEYIKKYIYCPNCNHFLIMRNIEGYCCQRCGALFCSYNENDLNDKLKENYTYLDENKLNNMIKNTIKIYH